MPAPGFGDMVGLGIALIRAADANDCEEFQRRRSSSIHGKYGAVKLKIPRKLICSAKVAFGNRTTTAPIGNGQRLLRRLHADGRRGGITC
jgi:hypothetical protein